ncbi:hypothetical protein DFH07DRAFT_830594 [Mycena maculata]|uniref:DUF1308 domain-containing protein n=1 Tax=Mycena maculata TaxID=230809 RepID=A0AAD7IRQ8_9AGAR|nr:hypothetical protein DFH07DRAFT_830594 [Mycena maculata]
MSSGVHPALHLLKSSLCKIHESLSNFRPLAVRPPILDSSTEATAGLDSTDDGQWLQQENIPGLKNLRDSVKIDLDVLTRFLDDPNSSNLPPLSTNAPYVIAVWNEVLCAPPPIVSVLRVFAVPTEPSLAAQKTTLVKVDVVADSGRRWIRVNTIKNSRIMAEFREIDSYLTDSDDEEDDFDGPSLVQTEFDNSVLRMGRGLVAAANAHPIDGAIGPEPPRVTLRLTRLNPCEHGENDPRISQTIDCLRAMGIDVEKGERVESEIPAPQLAAPPIALSQLIPTANINLDLSVLIALVSDLTHAPLPTSVEEAHRRFTASASQREPKLGRKEQPDGDPTKQARALTSQIQQEMLQEMGRGALFQELHTRLSPLFGSQPLQFWTTAEARDRFVRIVSKIGGPGEKRRADILFAAASTDAEAQFWAGSRYPPGFIPLLPVRIYSEEHPPPNDAAERPQFFRLMERTCRGILAQEASAPASPKSNERSNERVLYSNNGYRRNLDSERATVTRANARLTAHTVQSMLCGAARGWTTLTANKTSVKALLREIKAARVAGRLAEETPREDEVDPYEEAAIWILDPRSLAEGVRARVSSQSQV